MLGELSEMLIDIATISSVLDYIRAWNNNIEGEGI